MASTIKLTGFTQDGSPKLQMDIPWWRAETLRAHPEFHPLISSGQGSAVADLTLDQARALHQALRSEAERGVYALPAWQKLLQPMLKKLDDAFGPQAGEYARFRVEVSQWESGYE